MAKQQRGASLADGTYKKASGSRSNPDNSDPPGRGPSKTGYKDMQNMHMPPINEIQQLIAGAMADPIGAGPTSMRGLNTMVGHTPPMDQLPPEILAILSKIMGPNPRIMPGATMGDDENGPNEGVPSDPRLMQSQQLRDMPQ